MNSANAIPSTRFSALLVEGDKGLGLESALRDQGCDVERVSTRASAEEAVDDVDVIVVSAAGFSAEEVLDLVGSAVVATSILVHTDDTALAIKAAKLGAAIALGSSVELVSAQIGQLLAVVDLKRRSSRPSSMPPSLSSPNSSVVQRRSTPLPKEATPEALDALIAAAEGLVPMHKFQRVYVDYALRRFGGNKVHTAAALGIDRRTIQRWARARADYTPAANAQITSTTTSS